jgi:hypothetical protein
LGFGVAAAAAVLEGLFGVFVSTAVAVAVVVAPVFLAGGAVKAALEVEVDEVEDVEALGLRRLVDADGEGEASATSSARACALRTPDGAFASPLVVVDA